MSCESLLFLSADLLEKLNVYTYTGSDPEALRQADSILTP
jgi:hypothetical protein